MGSKIEVIAIIGCKAFMSKEEYQKFADTLREGLKAQPEYTPAADKALNQFFEVLNDATEPKETYTALYSLSATPGPHFAHFLENVKKLGLLGGHLNLSDSTERKNEDDLRYSRQFRSALQNIIAQENAAEAMRRFDDALKNAQQKIPNIMGPINEEAMNFKIGLYSDQIQWNQKTNKSLDHVIEGLERVQANPDNPTLEAAREATQDAIDVQQEQAVEVAKKQEEVAKLEIDASRRALESQPYLREVALNLPDRQSRIAMLAHLDEVERWLKSGKKTPLDKKYLDQFLARTNDPNLPADHKAANEQFDALRKDAINVVRELRETKLVLDELSLRVKTMTKKLEDIESELNALQQQPESERRPDFEETISILTAQKKLREDELIELTTQQAQLTAEANEMLKKNNAAEDERFNRVIEEYNKKYQQEGALSTQSKLLDFANQFWESAKGLVWNDDELRYRYQGHAVFLSAHTKMYYYLDENSNRVLVPLEEQKRFRKLDEDDAYSQWLGERQTENARKINAAETLYTDTKEAVENAAEALTDTISNTTAKVADTISDTANSLYSEALRIFSPNEDTIGPKEGFKAAVGNKPAPVEKTPAAPVTEPASP